MPPPARQPAHPPNRSAATASAGVWGLIFGWAVATRYRATASAPTEGDAVVALTNARLNPATRRAFDKQTRVTLGTLPSRPGLIGWSARTRVFGNEVWTMTVWKDEASLLAFVASPTHRAAVSEGMAAVRQMRFHRYRIPAEKLPPRWSEALALLDAVPFIDAEQDAPAAGPTGASRRVDAPYQQGSDSPPSGVPG